MGWFENIFNPNTNMFGDPIGGGGDPGLNHLLAQGFEPIQGGGAYGGTPGLVTQNPYPTGSTSPNAGAGLTGGPVGPDGNPIPVAGMASSGGEPTNNPWHLGLYAQDPDTRLISYVGEGGPGVDLPAYSYGQWVDYDQNFSPEQVGVSTAGLPIYAATDGKIESAMDFPTWWNTQQQEKIQADIDNQPWVPGKEDFANLTAGLGGGFDDSALMSRLDDLQGQLDDRGDSSQMMALLAALMQGGGNNEPFGGQGSYTYGSYYPSGTGLF